jgi:hypothetical protein
MKFWLKATLVMATALVITAPALAGGGIFGSTRPETAAAKGKSSGRRRSLFDVLIGREQRPAVSSSMNHGARWNSSMTDTTSSDSNFFTRTKELLMPWTKSDPAPMNPTGTRRVYQGKTPPEMKEQPSRGLFSWLFGAPEPQKDETVNDFLSKPKPGIAP